MLDIGFQELLVIMVLALIIFGPDKLPDLGRRLGRAMREFRRASDEFRSTVEQNLQISAEHDTATRAPFEPATVGASEPGSSTVASPDGHTGGTDSQVVAGAVAEPATEGPAADEPLEPFWTSRGGRLLHRRECAWRARVPIAERVPLKTAGEGWEQGLKPCPACDPQEIPLAS